MKNILLADIADISGMPEATVLDVAAHVQELWRERVASFLQSPSVQTIDFIEATALLCVLLRTGVNPICVLELGTQFGVSTWILAEGLKRLGIRPRLVTYDVERQQHVFDDPAIEFRQEDITDRCDAVLDELRPQAVFLDAHPWSITHHMTVAARLRGLIIFMHDVSDELWIQNLKEGRLPISGHEYEPGVQWERKVLETVFGPGIHTGRHVTDDYRIDLIRSHHGVAVCRPVKAPLALG